MKEISILILLWVGALPSLGQQVPYIDEFLKAKASISYFEPNGPYSVNYDLPVLVGDELIWLCVD